MGGDEPASPTYTCIIIHHKWRTSKSLKEVIYLHLGPRAKVQRKNDTSLFVSLRQNAGSFCLAKPCFFLEALKCDSIVVWFCMGSTMRFITILRQHFLLKYLWFSISKCFFLNKSVFPKIGVPPNGWFIMENPIKMEDLGVLGTFGNTQIFNRV